MSQKQGSYEMEMVMAEVSECGLALQYMPKDLKSNHEIVLRAVSTSACALTYASEELGRATSKIMEKLVYSILLEAEVC